MLGDHTLRFWSSTQKVIALSSGEAEYYGCVRAAAEGMGTTYARVIQEGHPESVGCCWV